MKKFVAMLIVIILLAIVEFNLGETSGKESICSRFKEHVLTTEGKCIKVEQESKKGAQQ